MRRWTGIVAVVLVLGARPEADEGAEFPAGRRDEVRSIARRLEEALARERFDAAFAAKLPLGEFSDKELELAPTCVEQRPVRDALARVCLTERLRRGPLGKLAKADEICFLIAGDEEDDRMRACALLRREPVGDDLDRAVAALGKDERPATRLLAAHMAITLLAFGRTSDGLKDTVVAALSDPSPNVAAHVAFHAADTNDRRVMDQLVKSADDARPLDRRVPADLDPSGWETAGGVVSQVVSWMDWLQRNTESRRGWWRRDPPQLPDPPKQKQLAPKEIRTWWKANRDKYGFAANAPKRQVLFDDVIELTLHKATVVHLADGTPLRIVLKDYREGRGRGEPVSWIEAEMTDVRYRDDETHVGVLGNPGETDWAVKGGARDWQVGDTMGELSWRGVFLPTHERGRVRLRLIMRFDGE